MCGICGVVQLGTGPRRQVVASPGLDAMTDLMVHRGPSDRGTHVADGIALGVRRLSIVDVAGGHQPVFNEDGTVVAIQNGELYNHRDVRSRLKGHSFLSHCDTEIIPHLYEEHGPRFPEHLRGMFGIAVWDQRRQRLVLARDRLGIKPLYYAVVDDLLVFASELKSVLASGLVDARIDHDAVDAYLSLGYFPAPLTPLEGVKKLLPGHRLIVDDEVTVEPFWSYPHATPEEMSLDDAAERLLHKLDESVTLRLMSDVPLGAMLSGGLDSSLIVALMARRMNQPVKTFSVGFTEDPRNELAAARSIAARLETEHHELELSITKDAVPLEELAWYLDEPLADLSALGFYAVSQLAAQHVTVALTGQGADELFGGYAAHRNAGIVATAHRIPGGRRASALLATHGPTRVRRGARMIAAPNGTERFLIQQGLVGDARKRALYGATLGASPGLAAREVVARHLNGIPDDPLRVSLHLHAQLALVDDMLHYFDRMSMAHSLEVRVPFLDHELVELAATIPERLKVRRRVTKVVLKEAARGLLPDAVVDQQKVGFFNAAMSQWIVARGRRELETRFLETEPACAELFDRQELSRLVREDGRGEGAHSRLLIAILMLELWLSTVLPRATAAQAAARA